MPAWQAEATVPGIVRPGGADYTAANSVQSEYGYPSGFCDSEVAGATPHTPCRLTPDVSADADEFTGAVTSYSKQLYGGWSTTGGTSSASPIWAGLLALVNDSPTCAANPVTADGVGFVLPLLYAVASNPTTYAESFTDITVGNNDVFGLDDGKVFPTTAGFDLATGLGSPELTGPGGSVGLATDLCRLAAAPRRPVVDSVSPSSLGSSGGSVTIDGSGFSKGSVTVAPPSSFPEGRISHSTSPNPTMSAGFVITLYQSSCAWIRPSASLKQPRHKIGEVFAPDGPHVGSRTLDPNVSDPCFFQSRMRLPRRREQKIVGADSNP